MHSHAFFHWVTPTICYHLYYIFVYVCLLTLCNPSSSQMVYSIRITGRRCCSPRINSALVKPCIRQPPRHRFKLHNTPYRPYRPTPFRFSTAHCYNHQFLRFRSTGFTPWSFRRSFTTETHQTTGKDMVDPTWDSDDEAGSVHTPGNVDEHLVQLIRVHSQKRPTRPGIDLLPKSVRPCSS